MLVFFFVLLFFIIFFFPLKLHVIDRTAAYTCGTTYSTTTLSPGFDLSRKKFLHHPPPLSSFPNLRILFLFFSLFSPHGGDEISSRIINSFLRFETRETHPALYPPPLKLISLAQTAAKWAKFPECGPRLGPATNVWRVWFLSSVSTTNGEPAAILAVPPPLPTPVAAANGFARGRKEGRVLDRLKKPPGIENGIADSGPPFKAPVLRYVKIEPAACSAAI